MSHRPIDEPRSPAASRSVLTARMGVQDANVAGNVHGGWIMKLCDDVAVIAATRHAGGRVVTAGVDQMTFRSPVRVGDVVTLRATVNAVWRTSLEVGVRVEAEDVRNGRLTHTCSAYLTMVALDDAEHPRPIPPLAPDGKEDERRELEAQLRREVRLAEPGELRRVRESVADDGPPRTRAGAAGGMVERVTLRASDLEASERFYSTVLSTLGIAATATGAWDDFVLEPATPDAPPTRGLHLGFVAPSQVHADAFWRAGTAAGHPDNGAPGPRPIYGDDYYGAFLLDPDGNSAEAVHHGSLRSGGHVDHLWIRVADLAAARAFYAELAPVAGLQISTDRPDRVMLRGSSGSFSLVGDEQPRSEHVHLTFRATDPGARGERTDPDGNTVVLA